MAAAIKVEKERVQIALGEFKAAVSDREAMLRICGELMRTSIARTFRAQGSPAGSWPELAASTRKKKGYTAGHKLLIMSGRLFGSTDYSIPSGPLTSNSGELMGSFDYSVSGSALVIGTSLVYAAVQQFGSRDYMGGAAGPRRREQMSAIGAYEGHRIIPFRRYSKEKRVGKDGRERTVRIRERGPENAKRFPVGAHTRRQNIPARPFLVFRPEDPDRMVIGIDNYLRGKAVRIGKVKGK